MTAPANENAKPRPIIIIKKGKHAHHGGAWKVAYADFVTAMMALFIVLWLLSTADPKTRKDVARYFREGLLQGGSASVMPGDEGSAGKPSVAPTADRIDTGKQKAQEEEDSLQREAAALRAELDRAASADPELADLRKQVLVEVTPEGLQIQLIDRDGDQDLFFDVASAELKPALTQLLKSISGTLTKIDNPLVIGGHTDAHSYVRGSSKTNWDLSYERANNARRVLESGPLLGRVRRVAAYGSSELYDAAHPFAASNRRLSILALRKGRTAR
jgi:chemotaxis protein MotB